jgi:hypothetical protein
MRRELVVACLIEGIVIVSIVIWELESGLMEYYIEDIIIRYWGKVGLLVRKDHPRIHEDK